MHQSFFSNNNWSPQLFVTLKNFLTRQECMDYQLLKVHGVAYKVQSPICHLKTLPEFLKLRPKKHLSKKWRG